jgi:hypothetical protein
MVLKAHAPARNQIHQPDVTASLAHRERGDCGTTVLGPDDGPNNDVAVMDDFIYGEPHAAP